MVPTRSFLSAFLVVATATFFGVAPAQSIFGGFRLPALCKAIVAGDYARAEQLARKGADVNAGHGCALSGAANRGLLDLTTLLLDRGANPNRRVTGNATVIMGGSTPLAAAVQSRDPRMVELLLRRGADAAQDFEAFSIVLNFGDVATAELLLAHGADPNMSTPDDEVAYSYVGERQVVVTRAELAPQRLDETARRYDCNISGPESLLHYALSPGAPGPAAPRQQIATLLLARGADPTASTRVGATPLMYAASWHQHAAMQMLLDAGADASTVDRCGRSARDYADLYPRRPERDLAPQTKALLDGAKR